MPENILSYSVDGRVADVPEDKSKDFLAKYPKAVQVMSFAVKRGDKTDTADVPLDKVDDFVGKYPTARPLHGSAGGYNPMLELSNAILFSNVKQTKQQVNAGSETEKMKQDKQTVEDENMSRIVESAYRTPTHKPLVNAGEAQYNDNGSVSYIDEKGDYKMIGTDDVSRILRKKQDQIDLERRTHGTPIEKAQYTVADYVGSILPNIVTGAKEIKHSITDEGVDWKDRTLNGLTGAMNIVGQVAKVVPASAGAVALWTGGTEAAQSAAGYLKDIPVQQAQDIYHAINLLTQPATEVRSWFTPKPMTPREQKLYGLMDNLAFLGEAWMVDRGITPKDVPTTFSPDRKAFIEKVAPPEKTQGNPDLAKYQVEKAEKMPEIVSKLKNRKPVTLEDLPILKDVVENASPEDVEMAQRKTQEKQGAEEKAIQDKIKEQQEKPKGDAAPDDIYPNLSKAQVKRFKSQNLSEPVIKDVNDKLGKQKVEETLNEINPKPEEKVENKGDYATNIEEKPTEKVEEKPKEVVNETKDLPFENPETEQATQDRLKEEAEKKSEEEIKPVVEEKPIEEAKPEEKQPEITEPEKSTDKDIAALQDRIKDIQESDMSPEEKEAGVKKLQDKIDKIQPKEPEITAYGFRAPKVVKDVISNIQKDITQDFQKFQKGIKEAKLQLPEKTDKKVFTKTAFDMAKSLAKEHTLKNYFYDKSHQKITDPVNKKAFLDAQNTIQSTVQDAIKTYGQDPEAFKAHLDSEAIGHGAIAEATEDPNLKLQSQHNFNSLSTISDMVRKGDEGKEDIRWINRILDKQNKLDINGEPKTAWTIEQAKLLEDIGRPNQPIHPDEYTAVEAALHPYDIATDRPITTTDIAEEFGKAGVKTKETLEAMDNYISHAYNFAVRQPQNLWKMGSSRTTQALFKDLYHSYYAESNGGYQERATQLERLLNPDAINNNWEKEEQNRVSKVMDEGFYNDRKYYGEDELKAKGLNDHEIGLYNHYQDVLKQTKEWFKDGYKANVNWDKISPEEQKSLEEKFPEWLTENNGYQHLKRKGDYYIAYHGLNDVTKTEVPQVEFFETQKEANERANNINSSTYEHEGVNKKYAALDYQGADIEGFKQYERNEGKIPEVHKKKDFDIGLAKSVGFDDPDYLYDLAGQVGINTDSPQWKLLNSYIENLKKKKGYIPSLSFHSNRIPGAPLDFQQKLQSLRDLGQQAAHYRQRRTSDNVWDDRMQNLQSLKSQKDQKAVEMYKNWKTGMEQFTANPKIFGFTSQMTAISYLALKPAMFLDQYMKNIAVIPPELIDRLQKGGIPAGKSDLMVPQIFAKAHWEGHKFAYSRLYPKGVDEFGNKVPKNRFKADDVEGNQRFRLMQRGFDRGTISNMATEWISDKDGSLIAQKNTLKGWSMGHATIKTRSVAFNAALHTGQKLGIKDDTELLNFAERFTYDTKYVYGKANKSELFRNKLQFMNQFTPLLNTHKSYLGWFYSNLDNWHKTIYKVAPRIALGGIQAGVPIGGVVLANMMNAWWTANKNANEPDPAKREPVEWNVFSRDATDAYKAQIEGANMPKFMKDIILGGAVDAAANDAGVKGGINTRSLVGLGKDYIQDYFNLPNVTGYYSNPLMALGKTITGLGKTTGDMMSGHFNDTKYDFLQTLKNQPYSAVKNVAKSLDWYANGHKLSGQVDYVPDANETVQSAMGFVPDRLQNYYTAEESRRNYTGKRKALIDQIPDKLNEALAKKQFSKIVQYYNNPSRQNAENLYGKDYVEDALKYRYGLKNTVGTLFKNSDLENDGKINDLGDWQRLDISIDHQDSYQTTKDEPKYSLQNAISAWLKNGVSKKELKEHPQLQQLYNQIFDKSIESGSMKSVGQLITGK